MFLNKLCAHVLIYGQKSNGDFYSYAHKDAYIAIPCGFALAFLCTHTHMTKLSAVRRTDKPNTTNIIPTQHINSMYSQHTYVFM